MENKMDDKDTLSTCLGNLIGLVIVALVAGASVNYLLAFFLDKNIPFIADMGIGLVVGSVTIRLAIVV
jgi:uncharacterized membrane protein required for colicin V production